MSRGWRKLKTPNTDGHKLNCQILDPSFGCAAFFLRASKVHGHKIANKKKIIVAIEKYKNFTRVWSFTSLMYREDILDFDEIICHNSRVITYKGEYRYAEYFCFSFQVSCSLGLHHQAVRRASSCPSIQSRMAATVLLRRLDLIDVGLSGATAPRFLPFRRCSNSGDK